MPKQLPPPDVLLEMLRNHPKRLAEVTKDVPAARLTTPPAEDEWSPNEILAHLRACGDVWGSAIGTMLASEDHQTIRAVNPRTWIGSTNYPELAWATSFPAYRRQRTRLVRMLQELPDEDWRRGARVTGAGTALERTVQDYAEMLAVHERSHVKQIARIVGERVRR